MIRIFAQSALISSISIVFLAACQIEQQQTDYLCSTADRKAVDGTPGTLPVFGVDNGNVITIGYSWNAGLELHSQCAPAHTRIEGTRYVFTWYEYGQQADKNNVMSLTFQPTRFGTEQIEVTRRNLPGQAEREFAVKSTDFDSSARVTKKIWHSEFPFTEIVAANNFDEDGIVTVQAKLNSVTKQKRLNNNRGEFDCLYQNNVTNDFDQGCLNESTLDQFYFNQSVALDQYLNQLNIPPAYETEKAYLCREVNRYTSTSSRCNQRGL